VQPSDRRKKSWDKKVEKDGCRAAKKKVFTEFMNVGLGGVFILRRNKLEEILEDRVRDGAERLWIRDEDNFCPSQAGGEEIPL